MPRLIDADELIKRLEIYPVYNGMADIDDIETIVREMSTVATDTNVLGKWIRLTGMAPPEYHGHKICSVCNSFAPYDPLHQGREMLTPYCPGCGSMMEVTGDE